MKKVMFDLFDVVCDELGKEVVVWFVFELKLCMID